MNIHIVSARGSRYVEIPWWYRLQFWIESDAVQLGIALITYYMICALVGVIRAMESAYEMRRALWLAFGGHL